ncbi:peptidoglycan editing factor PgeF [Luteimonas sp. MC1572]|uniref:peptidoglycan editing factor PgeF n=1 Tax=Luteimonas sp. MC1572 TaxID=2799325 RepID=UPI0018F08A78|nr:peptidoglycan editing factor PgeF [Luteimonas sp. MC1572]MBJ6981356.1 peptidoglycan editing factor PgeF [Luteimonas sp. MC1572]QQO02670.1 peptidoglycan editing factor PgeF [Luteimonas sp. MC1572]
MSAAPWLDADWPAPPGVRALVTLRHGAGASEAPFDSFNLGNARADAGDDPATVSANRARLVSLMDLPSAPRWLRQVHGTRVLRVDAALPPGDATAERARMAAEPEADAAVTARVGTVLAILTADCLPVVLAARNGGEVGAAHAGWRGLAAGVLERAVAAMRTAPGGLVAWLGPAAGPQAYEVGAEVREAFVATDADADAAFAATRPGHWRVDLYALARRRLQAAGLAAHDIHGGGLCTISEPAHFYSHRRDARTGRMATLAWLER